MRILIIEDEKKIIQMVKSFLEREGYAVDFVTDGEAGQKRLELHHSVYDLLVLDLMLPGRSGLDVCRMIRDRNLSIPVLVLTAKDSVEDKTMLLDAGADDYMVKPFSLAELSSRIRAILRRPNHALAPELRVADLVLNPVSRKVYRNRDEIILTLKEFRLLEYFMRNPGQAINRDQILDNLWDFDFDSFSNVVDVHINNLRKKLGDGKGGKKYFETVRGIGYKLVGEDEKMRSGQAERTTISAE